MIYESKFFEFPIIDWEYNIYDVIVTFLRHYVTKLLVSEGYIISKLILNYSLMMRTSGESWLLWYCSA